MNNSNKMKLIKKLLFQKEQNTLIKKIIIKIFSLIKQYRIQNIKINKYTSYKIHSINKIKYKINILIIIKNKLLNL
jgi:hypothetical protein